MCGGHALKSWASTQKNITLSSAEAELVAAVKMSTELIGITQLAADWGYDLRGKVHIDSTAAIGVIQRQGCGKMRHVRIGDLWIQEKVAEGDLEVEKIGGEWNPADLFTKGLGETKIRRFMELINQEYEDGRAEQALATKKGK